MKKARRVKSRWRIWIKNMRSIKHSYTKRGKVHRYIKTLANRKDK